MTKILMKNATTPDTPPSGSTAIYVDSTTKKLISKDDAGTETSYDADITSTSGLTDSTDKRFMSDAQEAVLDATSGTNTGDQTTVSGTSGNTDALNSATTIVDVSAATAPTNGQVLTATSSTTATWQTGGGSGDFSGPASSTDNQLVRFDGTGGKTGQTSKITVDDDGRIFQTGLGNSVHIGSGAGASDDFTANNIVAIGLNAGTLITTAQRSVCVGAGAGSAITTGQNNTCIGTDAGSGITTQGNCVAIGRASMTNVTGADNIAIGNGAMTNNSGGGTRNVAIGTSALTSVTGNANSSNVAIGWSSGFGVTTGSSNVFLGRSAGLATTTGSTNILIGALIEASGPTASSEINIGNTIYGNITAGSVGLGIVTPAATSILDLTSTTLGFLPPRMTTTQRDAITTPATGLTIYNTTTNKLNFYSGSAWEAVTSA